MGQVRGKTTAREPASPPPPPKLPVRLASATATKPSSASSHQFDKAFAVHITSEFGVANGVGRNISPQGMFIETREPVTIGTEVRVTFSAESLGTELVAVGEVRFQCYLNYTGGDGRSEGLRGMGIRFIKFEEQPGGVSRVGPTAH
jgi:hypothetical protein